MTNCKAWVYTRGNWSLSEEDFWGQDSEDIKDVLERHGFWSTSTRIYGGECHEFSIEMHERKIEQEKYRCAIFFNSSGYSDIIFITDFPSLWQFLREAKDIAELLEYQQADLKREENEDR